MAKTQLIGFASALQWLVYSLSVGTSASPAGVVNERHQTKSVVSPIASCPQPEGAESLAVSPDGKYVAVALGNHHDVVIIAIANRHTVNTLPSAGLAGDVKFSHDGRLLAVAYGFGRVAIWEVARWRRRLDFAAYASPTDVPGCVSFLPDGHVLITSKFFDHSVKLWDTATGRLIRTIRAAKRPFSSNISPDGRTLAIDVADRVHAKPGLTLLNIQSGKVARVLAGHPMAVGPVAFSTKGDVLATSHLGNGFLTWSLPTGRLMLKSASCRAHVEAIALSSRGCMLATGDLTGGVDLWDARTGSAIATLRGHTDRITSVVFSPNGKTLVTASADQTVKFWNVSKFMR